MDKRLSKITESNTRAAMLMLLLFVAVTVVWGNYLLALIELVAVVLLFVFYRNRAKRRNKELRRYVENLAFQMDEASKSTMVNIPLPTAILRVDSGEVLWGNEDFMAITGATESLFEAHIHDVVSGFDTKWIIEGKGVCPFEVEIRDRKYNVYGNMVRSKDPGSRGLLSTLFWVDVTDYSALRDRTQRERPVVSVIMVDSYEELTKGMSESQRSSLNAEIDGAINEWAKEANGIVRRLEKDRYLFVFRNEDLLRFTAEKFSILEKIHEIQNEEGITATLSIGIGKGECPFGQLYEFAMLGIEMALSRGGDQVVVKSPKQFDFYGGRTKELEKRTKVKSRVMANALKHLIDDSSNVFVMGHRFSDLDSVGAAAGICSVVRKLGKTPYFIVNRDVTSAGSLIDHLAEQPQYSECFITEQDAILLADPDSLLVVVDTSRPELVEAPGLLQSVSRVAVIDHHRRAASYIENAAISVHETYASSASELVSELLQYILTPQELLKAEAEALLAGIYLDTKGFTVKTGVRTFEAAAYLKQIGADTVAVRRMFSGGLEGYVKKYQIISAAHEAYPGISLAVVDMEVERAVASQAADEMINLAGIQGSFVVFGENGGTVVSGRSYGQVNVQVVLEKIGGGGSLNMAGAQFPTEKPEQVELKLRAAIEEYLRESQPQEVNV